MKLGIRIGINKRKNFGDISKKLFIIQVDTSKAGSNSDQFQFTGAQGNYDVVAKQNDIVVQTFKDLSDEETITLNNGSGVYVLEIKAKSVNGFTGMRFIDSGDKLKLSKVNQWGVFADNRRGLFFGCLNLNTLANDIEWLNIVTDASQMFQDCSLQLLPSEMTLANLQNGTDMFRGCPLTFLPFQMILSNLQNGSQMFRGCPLQSLPSAMTLSNLENGFLIFLGSQLTLLPSAITLANLQNGSLMFLGSNIDTVRYSKLLVDMQNLNSNTNVTFHGGNSKYNTSGETARNLLINNQSWSFSDGGLIPAFTIQVDSTENGTSNNNQFQFTGAEGNYNVLAKQSGNVTQTFNDLSDQETITFTNAGVYDLHIFPKAVNGFSRIQFNNSGDDEKVKDIKQWGNIVWSSFEGAFWGCKRMLVTATDIPNLSQVTSMDCMFRGGSLANPDTTNWNTSNVTSMYAVFMSAFQFNKPLNNWDVSNVTNIRAMFLNAFAFNQSLNNWNTSNVTQMQETFLSAKLFNQNINNWDVSGVENMTTMFYNAQAFNQPLNNWDVSNITTMHMFLEQSNMSAQNLADCYRDWSRLSLQQDVPFSAGTIKYNSSGQSGRNVLINTYNWSITDGGGNTDAFIIEVDTSKAGSNSDQFQFTGAQGNYDVVAEQNGMVVQTFKDLSDEETITFSNGTGVYVLEIKAKSVNGFTGMRFIDSGDKLKLSKVNQWGVFKETRSSPFFGCENLTQIANDNDWLNSMTYGFRTFSKCGLTSLPPTLNLNSLTSGPEMFLFSSLTSLPSGMALTNLKSANLMFKLCPLTSLPPLMILDNLENGNQMFFACQLTSLSSVMTLASLQNGTLMFHANTIDTPNYSELLVNMQNLNSNTNVSFSGGNSKYNTSGETARNLLINNQSWSFTDGGQS